MHVFAMNKVLIQISASLSRKCFNNIAKETVFLIPHLGNL